MEATGKINGVPKPSKDADWSRTKSGQERLRGTGFFEEPDGESKNGYYQGRPIIGRDTPINGGVYVGAGRREAIVVDDAKSKHLDRIYQKLLTDTEKLRKIGRFKSAILGAVYDSVRQNLPYNGEKTEEVARPHYGDVKVSIDQFVEARTGVCRHQALLAGYLLERLKKERYVGGTASVDRNTVRGVGGHAWVRYTNSAGDVFIIDPAQNYAGALKDLNKDRWFYERPEDKVQNPLTK